jgi:hypothetical protein
MKPYHLKDIKTFLPPYKTELAEMLRTTQERSIELSHGVRGFIIGHHVLTPYQYNQSLIGEKDGHKIVLTFEKTNRWGVSQFLLPYEIPCEPLHFRHEHIHADSFLFRVYRHITLCKGFKLIKGNGMYGLDAPDQFGPIYDRHCHLVGINTGVFCNQLLCIPIELLI